MMPGKLVVTIHDCVHVKFPPENLSRIRRYELYWRTKRAVGSASQILAVSNSTRDDLVNIFDLDAKRISVIHNALDERFAAAWQRHGQKNHSRAVSAARPVHPVFGQNPPAQEYPSADRSVCGVEKRA